MKKLLSSLALTLLTTISPNTYGESEINAEAILKKEVNLEAEIFKNSELSEEDSSVQEALIIKLNEKYLEVNNYDQEALNELYTNFIILGFNKAAFLIENDKNVIIDYNRYNEQGITPLLGTAISNVEGGNVEMAKHLLNKGINPNQTTKNNNISAISLAATKDNYKVVSLLILNNANFMAKDDLEMFPIDYAFKNKSEKSALIIKNALDLHIEGIRNKTKKS